MKKEALILILLISITSVSAQLADSPWPMYHGKATHGGQSSVDTSHVNGFVKWTFQAGGAIETSPVIGPDGTIYFGAHDNKLYAVNPDGTEKWNFYVGEPVHHEEFDVWKGILSTPAVAEDGTIYFSSLSDIFFALNPDGTEKWRYVVPFTADSWSSPVIGSDGTVYTGSARRYDENINEYSTLDAGGIFAFNPDGTLKWRFDSASDMAGSIAIGDDGTIYAFIAEDKEDWTEGDSQSWIGYIKAINPDGKEIWKYNIGFSESSPTITSDGIIYMGAGHEFRGFWALNSDGTKKWFYETPNDISMIPAVASDGTVYVGEWDGMFYAFNPDGSIKWTFQTQGGFESLISSPAIGKEGTIYFGAKEGFFAFNPDGSIKWHYQKDLTGVVSSPAIGSDGTIYVGTWQNKLYAFGEGELTEDISEKTDEFEYENKTYQWHPEDEGIDCFKPQSQDIKEKCDMFCYDNPDYCPDYFEKKEKKFDEKEFKQEKQIKKTFFQNIINWFKSLFSK